MTRIAPIKADDEKGFNYLQKMLFDIDPCINLTKDDEGNAAVENSYQAFEKFYYSYYGVPGTPEFEQRIKEINEQRAKSKK